MSEISVPSALLNPFERDRPLTPAMVLSLWVIADAIDKLRLPRDHSQAVELNIPTSKLRGTEGRSDNVWLKTCLDRMTGIKLHGSYRGDDWGAVMLAEWHLEQGGAMARLLVPPAAIQALKAGDTFAKIETHAAYRLNGYARTLYGALADKKRMGNKYWVYDLEEIRLLLGVQSKQSYKRFNNLRYRVLDPALEQINDFGSVKVSMIPEKVGRSIVAVRFDWQWKTVSEARETDEENDKVALARRKEDDERDISPLSDEEKKKASDKNDYREWKNLNPNGDFIQYTDEKWAKDNKRA